MELKYPSDAQKESGNYSFNRTFMELKWELRSDLKWQYKVLIVPLWNWNDIKAIGESKLHWF